ncbi:chaperonin 10-like protein [Hypoxylon cercidicola]|nr:chaperonin 10-like protein [Hypoxylon cercidicola]
MRALRYHEPHDLRLEHDVLKPKCLPHQIKVKPSFCGICGSDLHAYLVPTVIPFKDRPHPVTGETWPVTFGHEFSGDIVEVGSEVQSGLQVGDRVAVQPTICCNQCPPWLRRIDKLRWWDVGFCLCGRQVRIIMSLPTLVVSSYLMYGDITKSLDLIHNSNGGTASRRVACR